MFSRLETKSFCCVSSGLRLLLIPSKLSMLIIIANSSHRYISRKLVILVRLNKKLLLCFRRRYRWLSNWTRLGVYHPDALNRGETGGNRNGRRGSSLLRLPFSVPLLQRRPLFTELPYNLLLFVTNLLTQHSGITLNCNHEIHYNPNWIV